VDGLPKADGLLPATYRRSGQLHPEGPLLVVSGLTAFGWAVPISCRSFRQTETSALRPSRPFAALS